MAASPVNFLFGFLLLSITLWLLFIFASGLLAWILSRILGASVGFRVGGWKCLRDVTVKFKKGAIESISVGEIKVSLRQSLVKLGVGFMSRDPKLQVLICDLEVVLRPSNKSIGKKKTRKSRASGRGKWMIVGNIARYLSVCVTDLVLKTPKATIEIKELNVDISKDGGSNSNLLVRLQIVPITVYIGEPRVSCDQLSNLSGGGCSGQESITAMERSSAPFVCEKFSVSCEFGHDREVGIIIRNLDISSGEVTVNLNEGLLLKNKSSLESSSGSEKIIGSSADSLSAKRTSKQQQTLAAFSKYGSMFPEKVSFNLPKLDVNFVHREHGLSMENNIMGIQLNSTKSRSTEDVGESTRLDFQVEFSEIHLLREAGSSVLQILKLDLVSFVYIPVQPSSPVRAETEIKLGGTQCNIIISRLKPWLLAQSGQSSKKKKMVLREESSVVKHQSSDIKIIMWTCNVSAPEMTIVLFNMVGSPVYHGCSQSSHLFANNVSSMGTAVHVELGELNLHLADEYQECLKESVFGVESNSVSIIHIAKLKLLVHNRKLQERDNEHIGDMSHIQDANRKNEGTIESGHHEKQKKKESIFAVDVELLSISADLGDGVEATLQVQSIFSENARIGVLLEGLMLSFNGARICKSSRMQISRIPSVTSSASDVKGHVVTTWDWVIQGLDVHICMPYRLQLRAIDDVIEDMLRGLKLIIAAKTNMIFPVKRESLKVKKPSSVRFGCIKFCLRKLTVDIEEEPLQGWLDEHYQLLKKEVGELTVRLNFLDEFALKAKQGPKSTDTNNSHDRKIYFNDDEIDMKDSATIESMREEIYKRSFRSYYRACQNLVLPEGSGACAEGFQAGFKPSSSRTSLLSITALDLDVSLKKIDGGDAGMVEVLKELDPVCLENDIPFSRLYGAKILLNTGSLVVQLRNYTFPLFSGSSGKCEGRVVLAQQATSFQPQIYQDVYVGRWRKVQMLRSASGTTPPMKTYSDLPIHFQKGEVSYGVGYEPGFADVSYAFTVALRRANLSVRNPGPLILPPKKERSLPWWDDMRNYIHGKVSLLFSESRWNILATTDPYEKVDKLQIVTSSMEIHQSDGRVFVYAEDFKFLLSSLESLANRRGFKIPTGVSGAFLEAPVFTLEVTMDWDCESGDPMNHYLFALPVEGKPRDKVFDPFRSTSLSLRWNFCLRPFPPSGKLSTSSIARGNVEQDPTVYDPSHITQNVSPASPTFNFGAHDLAWILRFWSLNYNPPHKLRTFSRWPRFGIPRIPRSGNLSLDKVMTEFMMRLDATPACIKNMPLHDDDPAKGLTFTMTKLKYELCYSRGKQKYTFESKRDILDLVYQGLDLHMPKAFLNKEETTTVAKVVNMIRKSSQSVSMDKLSSEKGHATEKNRDDGFLLSSDYFTIRRQSPKADPVRLLAWQEAGRRNVEMTYVRSEFENGSETDEHMRSDPSDDDGYNVVIADNCQRVFVYGLKLLWTIENRDAVWAWVGGLSKAFESPKPSPSRQYAQRKFVEGNKQCNGAGTRQDNVSRCSPAVNISNSPSQHAGTSVSLSSPSNTVKGDNFRSAINDSKDDSEGKRHFMVNVIEPQFNLHSEDANGRFLLAAVSGRVLARSFHSVLHVGYEMIEQALGTKDVHISEYEPEMTWKRMEFSVMLEHVQAHVAPTDVDPGAGLQWLPKISRSSPKVMRTGALLERVFMPCDMYFRYTRHKGGTPELKVKPLKELIFNSHNITATMTSRQFQVMLDVLTNLLFARLPKPRKSSLSFPAEDDEDIEEEADEVVPDGVEEVELAKVNLEQKEREQKLLLDDIRKLSAWCDTPGSPCPEKESDLWMITGGKSVLVQGLKRELLSAQKSRRDASASLRMALQKAAQLRLMEKEKNKSPSYAMRISLQINKVVWSMLVDGKSFAEAEINDMIYDFDRDYKDVGVAQFTTKYFVVRNCLPNAKSDMLLSAWNPPSEWVKKVMLRVDAKQGAPRDGNSPLELFQVEIYPLKIHLTETMYRMMWEYFFPEEEQDSQRRQEVWKVSTTAGAKRVKKSSSLNEVSASSSNTTKESEASSKSGISAMLFPSSQPADSAQMVTCLQASKVSNVKANPSTGTDPELRRTSSFDRTWEETVAESVANELVLQSFSSSKNVPFGSTEQQDDGSKNKSKDSKGFKAGRSSHEEKKLAKSHEEKRSRPRKMMEFHNIKISQVELLVTYEGQRFVVNDLKLLMDQFHRVEFTGTWRRLFSRVKKHIIWGVLKSVTGMQGKKFNNKGQSQPTGAGVPEIDLNFSDNEGQAGKSDQYPPSWPKRPSDGAGDGFVTSIRGLFNTQRRKAKAFVLRTMRGAEDNDFQGDWSESDVEFSPFARQLTITKAKKLIRRHTKKFRSRGQKGSSSQQRESLPSSPRETTPFDSDSSSGSSPYEDFHE
ncbi:hypothetical protein AAHE18_17G231100 [Arachis hypogaea]